MGGQSTLSFAVISLEMLPDEERFVMNYCPTNDQVTDGFTKALSYPNFIKSRSLLDVLIFASRGSDER